MADACRNGYPKILKMAGQLVENIKASGPHADIDMQVALFPPDLGWVGGWGGGGALPYRRGGEGEGTLLDHSQGLSLYMTRYRVSPFLKKNDKYTDVLQ